MLLRVRVACSGKKGQGMVGVGRTKALGPKWAARVAGTAGPWVVLLCAGLTSSGNELPTSPIAITPLAPTPGRTAVPVN